MGWMAERRTAATGHVTMAEALVALLSSVGVEQAFGIVGGGIAPVADAILRSPIQLWHTRHEAGSAFCATEASFATGQPTAVFVTTGPGLTNALTGLAAARWDGAKIVVLSGASPPSHRGRWGVQETSTYTMPADLFAPGRFFDFALSLADEAELPEVRRRLAAGFARPGGFVAHLSLPLDLQTAQIKPLGYEPNLEIVPAGCSPDVLADCARRLRSGPSVLWLGFGARHAAADITTLAERTGAAVMCSPRAKGIFPEDHPQFLGVTGAGGHEEVERYLIAHPPEHTLVLGSRLGEVSSFWSQALVPSRAFIHVDVDTRVFGAAYPAAQTLGVQAEIGAFTRSLLDHLEAGRAAPRSPIAALGLPAPLAPRAAPLVRPQYLMQMIQRLVVDRTDAVVMTESGNSFGWGNQLLRFREPGRYRTSAAFGSMGHFVTGVVGAALARQGKAVAVVGDGAMLMNNEVSAAVQYEANAVWIVLNDGLYGITHQAMAAQGFAPVETRIPATDFVQFARSMGAEGIRVRTEVEVEAALVESMRHIGPFVIDVVIDANEVTPVLKRRIESLNKQANLAVPEGAS